MSLKRPLFLLPSLKQHLITSKFIPLSLRYYASSSKQPIPKSHHPSPPPTIKQNRNLPDSFKKTIPGETEQSNSLMSRLPSFPLRNNATLLPKPGVPTSATHSLRSMLEILNNKKAPELIYESEPHKLYFLCCGAFALVFTIYGLSFLQWSSSTAYELYKLDDDLYLFLGRIGVNLLIASVAGLLVTCAVLFPTRLIRRIYYLPGDKKVNDHIKFTTHPLLPGRTTPVHTIPLTKLNRTKKGRIFTKNGIYGTLDKSTLFFLLKEQDAKFGYWVVDRNGWFWGDGRVFDVIFGKDSLNEAENALTYDEKFGQASKKLKEEKKELKNQYGQKWPLKIGAEIIKEDVGKVISKINKRDQKSKLRREISAKKVTKNKKK